MRRSLLPAVVTAHTPSATFTCNSDNQAVLKADLTLYEPAGTNTVDVSIDGV